MNGTNESPYYFIYPSAPSSQSLSPKSSPPALLPLLTLTLAFALALALRRAVRVVGKSLNNTIVRRVLREVGEPETSSALAREDVGHPAKGVVEIPEGDADAALDLDAGADNLFY